MSIRLGCLLALTLLACSSSDAPGTTSSSSSSSSSGGDDDDAAVEPNDKVSQSACRTRCGARLKDDECKKSSVEASKACNGLCLETATNKQMECLEKKDCEELTHEESIANLCPP